MNHKHLIAFVGVFALVFLAGCAGPASLEVTDVDDNEIAEQTSRSLESFDGERATVRRIRGMLESAINNGSSTFNGTSPPIREGQIFEHRDSYYNISWNVEGHLPGTRLTVGIDYNPTENRLEGRQVNYRDLPTFDKELMSGLLPPRENPPESEGYDIGAGGVFSEGEINESMLASQRYDIVVYEGEAYPIQVETEPEELNIYNYTAELAYANSSVYADHLKDKYLFRLSGLSSAEEELMSKAMGDSYYLEDGATEAYKSLLKKLRRHEAVEGGDEYSGDWLVRYKGNVYWVEATYEQIDLNN